MDHLVVGVLGASGGLGVSSLAVALAVRAARLHGVTACVDGTTAGGGPAGGGLDVTACIEHLPGLRWCDLADAQGALDGAALLRSLPGEGSVRVLAARAERPTMAVMAAAVSALAEVCAVTVVDLGRSVEPAQWCTEVVVVSGLTARQLADASAVVPEVLRQAPAAGLVIRAGRHDPFQPEDVAAHLDLPLAAVLADDPRALTDADRALLPGARRGSALTRAADRVLSTFALSALPAPALP
ncbi:MAG TPA: hypothetical protein VGN48_09315 [Pedococcus sp.]|jgi:hypothetical protein|nr:hypothetical protein [Pedococcus sp.]